MLSNNDQPFNPKPQYFIRLIAALTLTMLCLPTNAEIAAAVPDVSFEQVPDHGIQPQLMTDDKGLTHLVYFRRNESEGRNRSGNLYYRQRIGAQKWSNAIKISQDDFSHFGPVSKASGYVDQQGRVHVVWFIPEAGYLYTRSDADRTTFEPARAVVTEFTDGLDAEASLAGKNNLVTITWHAGDLANEAARSVYSITSANYGATLGPATRMSDPSLGACACCALTT